MLALGVGPRRRPAGQLGGPLRPTAGSTSSPAGVASSAARSVRITGVSEPGSLAADGTP